MCCVKLLCSCEGEWANFFPSVGRRSLVSPGQVDTQDSWLMTAGLPHTPARIHTNPGGLGSRGSSSNKNPIARVSASSFPSCVEGTATSQPLTLGKASCLLQPMDAAERVLSYSCIWPVLPCPSDDFLTDLINTTPLKGPT